MTPPLNDAANHRRDRIRDKIHAEAQDRPGVYRFLGPRGETLYVGKSIRIRTRLLSHLRARSGKTVELLRVTSGVRWDYVGGELEALLLEFHWIRALRPRFNLVHRRERRFAWVRLTAEHAPRLVAVRGRAPSLARGERLFGPFPATRRLPRTLRDLARASGVRDCAGATPMNFSDQLQLLESSPLVPRCPRGTFGTCPAPCAGGCTVAHYHTGVHEAVAFLDGASDAPIERLKARMEGAAHREAFETASRIRDRIEGLASLRSRILDTRAALSALSFAYPAPGSDPSEPTRWMLFREARFLRVLPAPAPDDAAAVAHFDAERRAALEAPWVPWSKAAPDDRESRFLVARWFRDHPEARATVLSLEAPATAYTLNPTRNPSPE